jgi:hypothetical protein
MPVKLVMAAMGTKRRFTDKEVMSAMVWILLKNYFGQ